MKAQTRSLKGWTALILTVLGFGGFGSLAVYRLRASSLPLQVLTGTAIAIYLVWILWESRVSIREISRADALHDRGTMEFCAIVKMALLLAALAGGDSLIAGGLRPAVAIGGIGLMLGGIGLRTAAIRALGKSYSHRIRMPDLPLTMTGPYGMIRHPAYAGTLLIHSGVVCLYPNWFSTAALVLWFGAVSFRTRVEEECLGSALPEYRAYCLSVRGAWIPRLPRGSFQSYLPILLSACFIVLICALSAFKVARMPTALALALGAVMLVYLGWLLVESRLAMGEISKARTRIDRGTLELYAFGRAATVLSALAFSVHWSSVGIWYPIGFAIFLAGLGLRLRAIQVLGRFYSHRVRISQSHVIVTEGPYRILRHPAYSGMILAHCGFVVCFFNVTSLAILLMILAPAVILRIRVEERVLFQLHEYREYARGRARLIPLLW